MQKLGQKQYPFRLKLTFYIKIYYFDNIGLTLLLIYFYPKLKVLLM